MNMEELTEVITAAEFHPVHCNLFMYSSSKGTIKLSDMRESALCDRHAKRKITQTMRCQVAHRTDLCVDVRALTKDLLTGFYNSV